MMHVGRQGKKYRGRDTKPEAYCNPVCSIAAIRPQIPSWTSIGRWYNAEIKMGRVSPAQAVAQRATLMKWFKQKTAPYEVNGEGSLLHQPRSSPRNLDPDYERSQGTDPDTIELFV